MKAKTITRTVYEATDGQRFMTEKECKAHEVELNHAKHITELREQVDEIECIDEGCAPFGYGYSDVERYEYRWYRPKTVAEVEALNSFFNVTVQQDGEPADIVGEWVCVEIDGDFDGYTGKEDAYIISALEQSTEKLVNFYAELGYEIKIEKKESAVAARDIALEILWDELMDVPMDPITEKIEQPFLHFPKGTDRTDIWHWFDTRHSKGVAYLVYGDNAEKGEGV